MIRKSGFKPGARLARRHIADRWTGTEDGLQRFVVQLLKFNKAPGVIAYSVPNGAVLRNKREGARQKEMGLLPGVADLAFVLPPFATAAFLELKVGDNTQTETQEAFERQCQACGALYAVARSSDEAQAILTEWGVLKSTQPRPAALQPAREAQAA